LLDEFFERIRRQLKENLAVRDLQCLRRDFRTEARSESIVVIRAGVVVARRCKINQPRQIARELGKRARKKIIVRSLNGDELSRGHL